MSLSEIHGTVTLLCRQHPTVALLRSVLRDHWTAKLRTIWPRWGSQNCLPNRGIWAKKTETVFTFHFRASKLIQIFQSECFGKGHSSFFHKGRDLGLPSQKPIGRMTSEHQRTDYHTFETAEIKAKVLAISKSQESCFFVHNWSSFGILSHHGRIKSAL